MIVSGLQSEDLSEEFQVKVIIEPFTVYQYSNGKLMLIINSDRTLLVENTKFYHGDPITSEDELLPILLSEELLTNPVHQVGHNINNTEDKFNSFTNERYHNVQFTTKQNIDFKQSIGLGFFFPETEHMYGLPQRATNLRLNTTEIIGPYRLFN